jgi:hypothetical protein
VSETLFQGIPARIHAGRESSLKRGPPFPVDCHCLFILLLLLHGGAMWRLLLDLSIGLALLPASPHRPGNRSGSGSLPGTARDGSYRGSPAGPRAAPRAPSFHLIRFFNGLLLGSLNFGLRWRIWSRGIRINAGLQLGLVLAIEFIAELLVVALILLGIGKHPDLLCR